MSISSASPSDPLHDAPDPGLAAFAAAMAEGIEEGFAVFDRELRYVHANAPVLALLRRPLAAIVGRRLLDLQPGAAGTPFLAAYQRTLETGEPQVVNAEHGSWGRRWQNRVVPVPGGIAVFVREVATDGDGLGVDHSRYLRTILDGTPSAIVVMARDGSLMDMNAAGLRMLGVDDFEQARGRRLADFTIGRDARALLAALDGACRGDEQDLTFDLLATDGQRRRIEARLVPFRDRAGEVVAALGMLRDVTDRERLEQRLALVLEAVEDGVWDWDVVTGAVDFSPRWCRMLGYEPHEVEPHVSSWERGVHPDDWPIIRASLEPHLRGETPQYACEHRVRRHDGTYMWILDRGKVIARDAQGNPLRMVGTHTDVTRTKGQERALAAALEAARESEALARAAFQAMPGSLAIIDPDSARFLTFNDAAAEQLGYTREEFALLTVADIDAQGELEPAEVRRIVRGVVASAGRQQFRRRHRTRTGEIRDVLVTSVAYEVDGSRVACCSWLDITEQVRAEERLALALESAEDGLWDWNLRDDTAYVSPRWFRILGLDPATTAPGTGLWRDRLHPDDRERVWHELQAHLEGRTPQYDAEQRLLHENGTYVWVHARGKVVERDADGGVVRMVGTLVDITGRKVAEEARRETENLLHTIIDAAPVVLLVTDAAGTITLMQGGALGALGRVPGELVGESIFERFGAQPARERSGRLTTVGEIARRVLAGETVESTTALPSGVVHDNLALPLRDAEGRVAGIVGLNIDATERQRLEEQLRHAQKMEAVGQLAGGVAHDFNNLLTVIAGNLEFIRADLAGDGGASGAVREELAEIADATERARNLVRQLLAFGRKQPLRAQRVRLGDLVAGAEKLLRRVIGEEIRLAVRVGDPEAATVADPGQLEQVLMNLAVNARDAMLTPQHGHPGRGGTLHVEVDTVVLGAAEARAWDGLAPGRWARLVVRDTGHGMDAATLAHIFEPFFTTKDVGAGTGLGLATVHGIVRQAGGTVRAASAPGQGTTFTILLPPAPDASPVEEAGERPGAAQPAAAHATVLLVEDEGAVRSAARRMLERRGYSVIEAPNGRAALQAWARPGVRVDAVVTDVRMPEMGGVELVERLDRERPGIPVVFMSGYADQGTPIPAGAARAAIDKPFTTDVLLDALSRVLGQAARG